MKKINAIYLHLSSADKIWGGCLFEVIGEKHNVTKYDPVKPLEAQFANVEVLLDHGGQVATREIIEASPHLKLWQMITVGYDDIDLGMVKDRDIYVCNCPGETSASGLAESAIMFMLMLVKQYDRAQYDVKEGKIGNIVTDELAGKTLAIIGFGASGRKLAYLAQAFRMKLMIIEPCEIEKTVIDELQPIFVGKPNLLDKVITEADFISLHLPLLPETRGLINKRRIGNMKPTSFFINVARAGLVDEDALNNALQEGRIAGIGSDVFADNKQGKEIAVFGNNNLVALPHIAGTTFGTIRRRSQICLENLDLMAQGEKPNYRVY